MFGSSRPDSSQAIERAPRENTPERGDKHDDVNPIHDVNRMHKEPLPPDMANICGTAAKAVPPPHLQGQSDLAVLMVPAHREMAFQSRSVPHHFRPAATVGVRIPSIWP
jgi:hypothetical protein